MPLATLTCWKVFNIDWQPKGTIVTTAVTSKLQINVCLLSCKCFLERTISLNIWKYSFLINVKTVKNLSNFVYSSAYPTMQKVKEWWQLKCINSTGFLNINVMETVLFLPCKCFLALTKRFISINLVFSECWNSLEKTIQIYLCLSLSCNAQSYIILTDEMQKVNCYWDKHQGICIVFSHVKVFFRIDKKALPYVNKVFDKWYNLLENLFWTLTSLTYSTRWAVI